MGHGHSRVVGSVVFRVDGERPLVVGRRPVGRRIGQEVRPKVEGRRLVQAVRSVERPGHENRLLTEILRADDASGEEIDMRQCLQGFEDLGMIRR